MNESDGLAATTGMEVAIIGMAGRFPGAKNVEEFWRNVRDGIESITYFTDEELLAAGADPVQLRSPLYVKAGRVMEGYDRFDAAFFGISPREAEVIDPQQRVFLECAWQALEDAGYDPERAPSATGVFAGARFGGYLLNVYSAALGTVGDLQIQVGNDKDYLATRVSHKLNLGGPSITVQTACSTALVAIHLGRQALLAGECDLALAGGVGVRIPEYGYLYAEGDLLSPDGRLRAFDAGAQGTVFGSGMGVVVLKRLADALADRDTIRAVVKGSAVTNDGARKAGFTAPGVDGQTRVVRAAQLAAEVEPETIGYIEAHGTGTPVGDPIEITALTQAFRESTDRRGFCAIGSVKANIGHLGAAAGIAGVIKAVLALEHRQIPPSLLFERPNPEIDFAASPFYVNTRLREWLSDGIPRRAGVSAFGMGGTNAHLILEEAPPPPPAGRTRPWQLLCLAGRTGRDLEAVSAGLAGHLRAHSELALADVAYTLKAGRKAFEHRRIALCQGAEEAAAALETLSPEQVATRVAEGKDRPVAFLFSGQGSQYPGMGAELYREEPIFRAEIDHCCALLAPHLGLDLRDLLVHPRGPEAEPRLDQTAIAQPALFVLEHALARLWMEWGIVPQAMLGHSIGEYVAACLAGVFSLEDGLTLVAARGRLMQSLPAGAMLAVPLAEGEVEPLLGEQLSLAAVNAPRRCVVSGPQEAIEALHRRLAEQGLAPRRLHTSHAFHSAMMEPILAPFVRQLERITLAAPRIPYISNVTGTWVGESEATDPGYWARHLRQPVRFADGVRELLGSRDRLLLEVGPGNSLATLARQHPDRADGQTVAASLPHPRERKAELPSLLRTLGELWLCGAAWDESGFYAHEERRRVSLPGYPFAGERYWIDFSPQAALALSGRTEALKKPDLADWFYLPSWKASLPAALRDSPTEPGGRWLVFLDPCGLGARIAGRLRRQGRSVVTVALGEGFSRVGEGAYTLAPAVRGGYDELLRELAGSGSIPDFILHLWNVGREEAVAPPGSWDESSQEAENRSFWSLFFLAQACGKQNLSAPLKLVVVSNNLQRVKGESYLCPDKALLLGPCLVIPREYPYVRAASIDLVLPAPGDAAEEELALRLIAETAGALPDAVVAYRGEERFVRRYEAARIESPPAEQVRLRRGGVYLITGGLGGIGLVFAEFLAREFQARLALLGFSPLPPRAEWQPWVASHGEQDRVSRRIRKVQELEQLGAEVLVLGCDVADEAQLREAVGQVLARYTVLHGVIHAAGLAGGGVIQLKSVETAAGVLAPKRRGTRALDRVLADLPLDFLMLCSSTIALIGGLGQVDYCAANSFLDAFAQEKALAGGTYTVSINWGAWEEVGMAVATGLMGGPRKAAAAAERQDIHPLIDRCERERADETVYETDFSAARHWVLSDHRLLGRPALPGTSYLEMARAAFSHHAAAFERQAGAGGVELTDVFFLAPLMLDPGETRPARLWLTKEGEGFAFRVASRPAGGEGAEGGEPSWQAHARGRVRALAAAAADRLDLAAIRERCGGQVIEVTEPVMSDVGGTIYWGPRWQSLRRVEIGDGECLARLELAPEFASDLQRFGLHPALLDVATGLVGFVETGTHLPLSYQRLTLRRPLAGKLYSHLRKRGAGAGGTETVTVDVTLSDEHGEVLVEIERFVMRKLADAASALRRAAAAPAEATGVGVGAAPHPGDAPPAGVGAGQEPAPVPGSQGILSREGVEVLRRVLERGRRLPQVVATAKDLQALFAQVSALTRSGLMERPGMDRGPRPTHARPDLSTPYAAPSNDAERRLAEMFQSALGIAEVGIHDNFFDLGGDSMIGIQVMARASEAGLQLSPDQLFEHQTIAELAALLAPEGAVAAPRVDEAVGRPPEVPFADSDLSQEELAEVLAKLEGRG